MKKLLLLLFLSTPLLTFAQYNVHYEGDYIQNGLSFQDSVKYGADPFAPGVPEKIVNEYLKDGYTMKNGWKLSLGDTLQFGNGSLYNKKFAFIYESPASLFSHTSVDMEHLHYMPSQFAGRYGIINDFGALGNKRSGWIPVAVVKVGAMVRYMVQLNDAIGSGEIIPPAPYRSALNQHGIPMEESAVDRLLKWKKLLDMNGITQHEYDSVKAAILKHQ